MHIPKRLKIAGSLKKYAKKDKNIEKIMKDEGKVLEKAFVEKYKNNL